MRSGPTEVDGDRHASRYQALKAKSWQLESHTDIADLHRIMSERAPYRANRLAALLSKMLALAIR